jgi:hypothetical protein
MCRYDSRVGLFAAGGELADVRLARKTGDSAASHARGSSGRTTGAGIFSGEGAAGPCQPARLALGFPGVRGALGDMAGRTLRSMY